MNSLNLKERRERRKTVLNPILTLFNPMISGRVEINRALANDYNDESNLSLSHFKLREKLLFS